MHRSHSISRTASPIPNATSCEHFTSLAPPRVRTLFDLFEISKCPTMKMHYIETAAIYARPGVKSKSDGLTPINCDRQHFRLNWKKKYGGYTVIKLVQ